MATIAAAAGALVHPPADAQACANDDVPASQADNSTMQRALRCVINTQRARRGEPPVSIDGRLTTAAARHARDMVRRRYFSHVAPDGSTFVDRIRRTGYLRGRRTWRIGEILAWVGSRSAPTARNVVAKWLASPPHRRVLLDARYREVGVGVAAGTPGRSDPSGTTATADFGTRP